MKNHLYEDKQGVIHSCEGAEMPRGPYWVWTECGKDVPANASFESYEEADCPVCGDYHEKDSAPYSCKTGDGM